MKVNLLITGLPGVGKSSLINKIIEEARSRNLIVGGILTPEVRSEVQGKKVRIGFLIVNLLTREQDFLAKVGVKSEYRVSKYGVIKENIENIGVRALETAKKADLIIIDEIGKMELFAPTFVVAVREAFDSSKPVLGTIGKNVQHPFIDEIKKRRDIEILNLTRNNRDEIYQRVFNEIFADI
ncbi:MAG: NTPase [Candidatus Lokiarchaeia archaeon]